jgi:hypothetical protein
MAPVRVIRDHTKHAVSGHAFDLWFFLTNTSARFAYEVLDEVHTKFVENSLYISTTCTTVLLTPLPPDKSPSN